MIDNKIDTTEVTLVPEEIKGWNWGAFILNWIWGIGNNTYRALWVFVPYVNLVFLIYLGFKGNELAWKHKKWESIEHFKAVQKKWKIAAFSFIGICAVAGILGTVLLTNSIQESPSYKVIIGQVESSEEVIERIGANIQVLNVSRVIQFNGEIEETKYELEIQGETGIALVRSLVISKDNDVEVISLEVIYH